MSDYNSLKLYNVSFSISDICAGRARYLLANMTQFRF